MSKKKTDKLKEDKCNKNWHIYNNGMDKPCQCGKKKSFNEEINKLINE